jgi:hypothetical protein
LERREEIKTEALHFNECSLGRVIQSPRYKQEAGVQLRFKLRTRLPLPCPVICNTPYSAARCSCSNEEKETRELDKFPKNSSAGFEAEEQRSGWAVKGCRGFLGRAD